MLSGVLMLRHLGEREAGDRLEGAIAAVIERGRRSPMTSSRRVTIRPRSERHSSPTP